MTRILMAVFMLAAVAVLSTASLWQQSLATEYLIGKCDRLTALYEAGDTETCQSETAAFSDQLKERMKLFPFFLHHDRLEPIFRQAAALPYLIDDPAEYTSAVSSLKMQLQILMDSEWPVPENIL